MIATVTGYSVQLIACMAQEGLNEEYMLTAFETSKGSVLPIGLGGFFAKINTDNHVLLNWQTLMDSQFRMDMSQLSAGKDIQETHKFVKH